jgi:hypothetical protein
MDDLYLCTDEDIAIETPNYRTLCPSDAIEAYGKDGTIDPSDPWKLTSATVNFASNNVRPNTVIYLIQPEDVFGPDPGDSLAVSRIDPDDPHSLILRRKGKAEGEGDPPGTGAGAVVGIEFEILTLASQIAKASREVDDELGISDAIARRPGGVLMAEDAEMLSERVVCKVLERRYMAVSKGTDTPGAQEIFLVKSKYYADRGRELETRLSLRFTTGEPAVRVRKRWSRII